MVLKDLLDIPESEKEGLVQTDEKLVMEKEHRRSKKKWI